VYDFTVIGADIVGLSSARALAERYPSAGRYAGAGAVVLEKESGWAHHQTGHNT
jgi:(S)-2-hydroxyglutarate dehydrogenase